MINVVCKLIYRDNLSMKARVGVPCAPREPTIVCRLSTRTCCAVSLFFNVGKSTGDRWREHWKSLADGDMPLFSSSHHRSQAISSKITKTGQNDSTTAPLTFNLHFFGTRQRQKTMNGFPYSLMWLGYY